MKIIISTGQGRLHLIESSRTLKNLGLDIIVITGWIPSEKLSDSFINFLGRLAGRTNLSYGLKKRNPTELRPDELRSCSISEFIFQFLSLLSKSGVINKDYTDSLGWRLFGLQSKSHFRNANIFHVRSGAGQGGAIKKARNMGMKIVVDHSIAHPAEVFAQLIKANNGSTYGIRIDPKKKFWKLVLKDCQEADMVLVNSSYVKESFIENGFSEEKIEVINLGIGSEFHNLKTSYSINEHVRLLFTGGFGRRKGAHLIVNMVKTLIQNSINFELDIVGTIINDFNLPVWFTKNQHIKLHGHIPQEELKQYFQNSDLYIFPSYSEGAAQSLKEAMAAGMPVIATKQSGAPIIHKSNGWLIPDDSATGLTKAVLHLAADESLRKKLGQNAAKTIAEEHTWEQYGEKVVQLYKRLINKHNEQK